MRFVDFHAAEVVIERHLNLILLAVVVHRESVGLNNVALPEPEYGV